MECECNSAGGGGRSPEIASRTRQFQFAEWGILEKAAVAEVVETATELLISRAAGEDEMELYEWTEVLEGEWLWKDKARDAAVAACGQVMAFVKLLLEAPSGDDHQVINVPTIASDTEWLWSLELQQIPKMNTEEANRRRVAKDIESMVRRKWPRCKLEVFGSSLSLYGSLGSDLDMSMLTKGPCRGSRLPDEMLGFYYLKRLVDRKVWDEEEVKTDLGARVQQLERVSSQALDSPSRLYNSKDPKQQQHAVLFDIYMELLEEAVTSKIDGIYWRAEVYGDTVTTPKNGSKDKLLRDSKRRKNELFDLKSILEAEPEIQIQSLASHARPRHPLPVQAR